MASVWYLLVSSSTARLRSGNYSQPRKHLPGFWIQFSKRGRVIVTTFSREQRSRLPKLGVVPHTCDSSTEDAEAGG